MSSHFKTWMTAAFISGILLTLGFKDFYPDLQRRSQWSWDFSIAPAVPPQGEITLKDEEEEEKKEVSNSSHFAVREGIEGAVGNTPLIRIKSLSDATGCDIFGKAEVRP